MSEFKMTVYADPNGPTGHFSVSVSGPGWEKKVQGKYPGQGDAKLPFGKVAGEVRDDSKRVKGDGVVEREITLTGDQATKVRDYMNEAKTSPGNFQLLDDNCVDFVQGAMDAAGDQGKLADQFEDEELKNMGWAGSAGGYAISKADKDGLVDYDNPADGEIGGVPGTGKTGQPPQSDPGNADVKGSSGKDDLSDRESAQPAYAPEIQNFLEDLKKSDDPVSEILLKDSSDWTQKEVNRVHASDAYQIASNPRRAEATGKVKAWYDQHYTTNPVQKDETGKTVEPVFTTVPRKEPVPARGKDGQPVMDGVLGAGAKIADMAGKNGLSTAIRGAQTGFNLLRKLQSGSENGRRPDLLKTDGLYGPRTKQALRGSVAELGRPKVENAVALGTFQNLLEKKRGDLAQTAHDSFSGLFQKSAPFKIADRSPTPWGLVVQDTLNDVGGDGFKPLKSDGWIGPKTADAFRRTVKPSGMGGFLEKLGSNFGFF